MSTAAPTSEPVTPGTTPLPTVEQLPDDLAILKQMILELLATLHEERRDKDALRHRLDLLLRRLYGVRTERFDPNQPLLFGAAAAAPTPDSAVTSPETPAADQPESRRRRRRARPHGRGQLPANLERRPEHHELSDSERLCACGHVRLDIGADVSEQLDYKPASLFVRQHFVHKYLCPHCAQQPEEIAVAGAAEPSRSATTGAVATTTEPPVSATTEMMETAKMEEPVSATTPSVPTSTVEQPLSAAAEQFVSAAAARPEGAALATLPSPRGPIIVSATKPAMPIAKGLPGAGLLADIIVSKYLDHLPLYRQEHKYDRQGVHLTRSTLCDWMAAAADVLRPLYQHMIEMVLRSRWLHTDDTPIKIQDRTPGNLPTARLWVYLGDPEHPYNVFDFTLTRRRDGPEHFLTGFQGYLHADAFSGYDALYLPQPRAGQQGIIEVACNAHARRKFYEARTSDVVRSHQALAYYAQLYEIERWAKEAGASAELRWRMRQDLAVPILDKFKLWLEAQRVEVLPKSPMAEAFGYALHNWTALVRYTEAGFLAIDNNWAEREMKRIAIGRKNWLFVGSERGGHTAAVLFSFTSTCQRLRVEPWAYLQDVLTRLPTTPAERLGELLPDRWQAARTALAAAQAAASNESAS